MISLYIHNTPSTSKTINSNANSVNVQLSPPIILDATKKYQLRVLNANIVYYENNITSAKNKFTYTYNSVPYTKTLPVGLYSIDDTIKILLQDLLLFKMVSNYLLSWQMKPQQQLLYILPRQTHLYDAQQLFPF